MVNQTILPRVEQPKSLKPRIAAGYHIEAQAHIIGFGKIEAEAEKLGLDTKLAKIKIMGNNGFVCGTDRAKNSSIVGYKRVWSGLLDWSIAHEDWESGIILHRSECHTNPLPVNLDLAIHYSRFRTYKKGTVLKHHKRDEPILLDGAPVLCRGDWTSTSTLGIFGTAVSKLQSQKRNNKRCNIKSLLAKIKGKRDNKWLHFAIWDDKDCTGFSAARAILLWISLTGIKGGYLFPSLEQLDKKVQNPTEHYGYDSILEDFKYLCACILKKDMLNPSMQNMILGTHMLQKTAFLLAFWVIAITQTGEDSLTF
jgi:hypothetical protein